MAKRRLLEYRAAPPLLADGRTAGRRLSLTERLKVYTENDADPVPPQLMRKYIAYARRYCHPILSPEAKEVRREVKKLQRLGV